MIDITGVRHIQERIAQLQAQFGMPGNVPGMEFSKTLDKAIQRAGGTDQTQVVPEAGAASKTGQTQSTKNALPAYSVNASLPLADQSLSGLISEASQKYKVDPKLLSAIAEVESGGNQDETSSASSRTAKRTASSKRVRRWMWSRTWPGVPITIWTPFRSAVICRSICWPP